MNLDFITLIVLAGVFGALLARNLKEVVAYTIAGLLVLFVIVTLATLGGIMQ